MEEHNHVEDRLPDKGEALSDPNREQAKSFLGIVLAIVFAVATFFSGLHIGSSQALGESQGASLFTFFSSKPATAVEEPADLTEFWRVWDILEDKFVSASSTEDISVEKRVEGAIDGLVDSYDDPYTVYLPPREAEFFEESISGNFSGVGMEVGIRDDMLTVIAPLPDTPALKSGIVAGDVIVEIDGVSTEDMNIDDAVGRIRGEKGSVVDLTIYREGEIEFLEIAITRDDINIPTVKTSEEEDVFVIALYSFNALSEMRMQEALREFTRSGTDKLILDLRGNPGGFLQSAISIGGYFLPAGKVIVREQFGDGSEEVYRSQGKTLGRSAPKEMVVLVDEGSASASEILAGALQEHEVATLIGESTFGKGSVQELVELPGRASLKVTIARWLTPEGVSISEGGLTPDIEVERTAQQQIDGEDPQMEEALKFLSGE